MNTPTNHDPKTNPESIPSMRPWEQYLPSKRIKIIIVLLLAIGLLYSLKNPLMSFFQKVKNTAVSPLISLPQSQSEQVRPALSTEKDTDGDGLLDWQEVLLGTDPTIPNSKEEVPQDIRDFINSSNQLVDTSDKLVLKVYQRLQNEPVGSNIEESIQAATTKEILDLADSIDQQLTTYVLDDITIVDDTEESRTNYKIAMQKILPQINPSDAILEKTYSGILKDTEVQTDVVYQAKLSQNIKTMLSMPVPLKMAEHHLKLLNAITHGYEVGQKSIESSREKKDDSLRFASFLVFQKNLNLAQQIIFVIVKII